MAITSFEIDTRMWQFSIKGEFRVHLDKVFAEYGLDLIMSHKIWKYMRDEKKLSSVFRSMKWFEIDRGDFIKQKGPWIIYKKDFTRSGLKLQSFHIYVIIHSAKECWNG